MHQPTLRQAHLRHKALPKAVRLLTQIGHFCKKKKNVLLTKVRKVRPFCYDGPMTKPLLTRTAQKHLSAFYREHGRALRCTRARNVTQHLPIDTA